MEGRLPACVTRGLTPAPDPPSHLASQLLLPRRMAIIQLQSDHRHTLIAHRHPRPLALLYRCCCDLRARALVCDRRCDHRG